MHFQDGSSLVACAAVVHKRPGPNASCLCSPWINNCVAAFNQKYFLLFLCWTGVMCIYSGCVIGVGIYRCAQSLNQVRSFLVIAYIVLTTPV